MSLHWQVSVSSAGTLYFGGNREKDGDGSSDLYCSRLVNGEYTEPVNLGPAVNTKDSESQPFISPDESFILFFRAPGQVPSAYVSFKGSDGRWLPAVKFDLPWTGAGLIVSPDGQYLFASGYWKSAKFLEAMRREPDPTIFRPSLLLPVHLDAEHDGRARGAGVTRGDHHAPGVGALTRRENPLEGVEKRPVAEVRRQRAERRV